jgi:type IV pilus assembly protein PilB
MKISPAAQGGLDVTQPHRGDRTMSVARQLSDVLLDEGLIGHDQLERAAEEQRRTGKSLGRTLIELGLLSESGLVSALAKYLGLEYVDLADRLIDPAVASLIPEGLARRYCLVPVALDETGTLQVAMSDPSNVLALDDIRTVTDREVRPLVATRADIVAAIDRFLRTDDEVGDLGDLELEDGDDDLDAVDSVVDDAPIVKFVNALISRAVKDRASDIHIEPQERNVRVRYRVDGVLHEIMTQNRKIHPAVVSRLKIMAELDIAERRIPQDGRISLKTNGKAIDLRVSTLPTVFGEKVVMRILDKTSVLLELSDLGFLDHNYQRYKQCFRKPYGMILVTGPTGSGKSTTLYATLNVINRPEVNIVTTEDPVEYRLPGVNQVQIHPKSGLTFPRALRSILRQDPDVVLVGEMRDHETAQIGMEAALTGHLVLSTLHTNDAPSTVTRLIDMGLEPFNVAAALNLVTAQRLVRRICDKCRVEAEYPPEYLEAASIPKDRPSLKFYKGKGCDDCGDSGYRGRQGLYEVLAMTPTLRRMIMNNASADELREQGIKDGMLTLRMDGLLKVERGITTLEEVIKETAAT